jgi:uncharacterized repeat protein (TIGR03803 family)
VKTRLKYPVLLPALIAVLGLILAGRATAQTFTILYSFTATQTNALGNYTNRNGAIPSSALILSGNTLYGTTSGGGSAGNGAVFALNPDGTSLTNLHSFTAQQTNALGNYTNSDGAYLRAGLILSGNTLYGMAEQGGTNGSGTVFAVHTDGTGFMTLHTFTNSSNDGANPYDGLILSGNTLYGTTSGGGSAGNGTVFALNINGTGFTNLHSFSALSAYYPVGPLYRTNSDGANPDAGLILSGSTLYGVAAGGGSLGFGSVFAVNTNGTSFTTLHSFAGAPSEGYDPLGGLVLSGTNLYGTTEYDGSAGYGTVFVVNTNGTVFTTLHHFAGPPGEGGYPYAGLILSSNILYGTTWAGGSSNKGTVFAVNTEGTVFTNLYSFTATAGSLATNSDGVAPYAGLILSGNILYGAALRGGSAGNGTVFSLALPLPQLAIMRFETNVVLTWPTNNAWFSYTGFTLHSTTNLVSPVVWSTVSPVPVVVNGQNAVTNPISGTRNFYRLSQQ